MAKLLKPIEPGKYISPEEALKEIAKLPEVVEKPEQQEINLDDAATPDAKPADNSSIKSQDQWIEYFNKEDKIMIAMPDLYRAGKFADENLLESLRRDLLEGRIITSTRIEYNPNDLNAKIIHFYRSNIVKPIEFMELIPEYPKTTSLDEVLSTKKGLNFLRSLFSKDDSAKEIKHTLWKLSMYDSALMNVWTPLLESRVLSERAPSLYYSTGFHIDCGNFIDMAGRSRRLMFKGVWSKLDEP